MTKEMLVCAIVTTIVYISFDIWNVFVKKKQIAISVVDIVYCTVLSIVLGRTEYYEIMVVVVILIFTWLTIIAKKCDKNEKEKTKAN